MNTIPFNPKVQEALRHVANLFPEVTQVFYGTDARWLFCGETFEAPDFQGAVDVGLLEDAADTVEQLPAAFRLLTLADLYSLWDQLANVPTADGDGEAEVDTIETEFLHFPVGTHREEVWHWFEKQHPQFIAGEVLQGIRRSEEH